MALLNNSLIKFKVEGKIYILIIILVLLTNCIRAQFKKDDFSLYGHVQELNTIWIQDFDEQWLTMHSVYNRLNLKWYIHDNLTFTANVRNMLNFGQLVYDFNQIDNYYNYLVVEDPGFFDLTEVRTVRILWS